MELWVDIIGYGGAACLLSAYFWASKWEGASDRKLFHGLNLIGAIGIGANSYYFNAMPSAWLNVLWAIFGVLALHRLIMHPVKAES